MAGCATTCRKLHPSHAGRGSEPARCSYPATRSPGRGSTPATTSRPTPTDPATELAALVRARDGRCRFPGCSIAARSCDLDHVRPWPTGRTAARNLLTLCRRHHRIKQRPGWRLRLNPDGTATWTDPTGRERTTTPLNALQSLVLRADPGVDGCHTGAATVPTAAVNLPPTAPVRARGP